MKLSVVVLFGLLVSACAVPVVDQQQANYVTPIIRSDVSSSGYTPSVAVPAYQKRNTSSPLVYPAPSN